MYGGRSVKNRGLASVLVLAATGTLCGAGAARGAQISCTITAVGVSFGTYNVFSASPLDSTGSVSYVCVGNNPGDRITIDLSRGGASTFARRMLKGAEPLSYNLYLDAGHATVWGDGTTGSSRYGPVQPLSSDTRTIFGRIPAGQDASAGAYSDTVIVTINF
jgi:spore coat protein U-like protein